MNGFVVLGIVVGYCLIGCFISAMLGGRDDLDMVFIVVIFWPLIIAIFLLCVPFYIVYKAGAWIHDRLE